MIVKLHCAFFSALNSVNFISQYVENTLKIPFKQNMSKCFSQFESIGLKVHKSFRYPILECSSSVVRGCVSIRIALLQVTNTVISLLIFSFPVRHSPPVRVRASPLGRPGGAPASAPLELLPASGGECPAPPGRTEARSGALAGAQFHRAIPMPAGQHFRISGERIL